MNIRCIIQKLSHEKWIQHECWMLLEFCMWIARDESWQIIIENLKLNPTTLFIFLNMLVSTFSKYIQWFPFQFPHSISFIYSPCSKFSIYILYYYLFTIHFHVLLENSVRKILYTTIMVFWIILHGNHWWKWNESSKQNNKNNISYRIFLCELFINRRQCSVGWMEINKCIGWRIFADC